MKQKGIDANLDQLVDEIRERDERDRNRNVAPLVAADDAVVIDSTVLGVEEVLARVLQHVRVAVPELSQEK